VSPQPQFYEGSYGAEIELLQVTDNEADALKNKKYAESKGGP